MKILNLSRGFKMPVTEQVNFEAFTFNGGEPHIKLHFGKVDTDEPVLIAQRVCSAADFMLLLLATDALRRAGCRHISAFLPYFPAARQDRVMVPGEPLSVKVFADLINLQQYAQVHIFDPHSDVTPALLDRASVTTSLPFIQKVLQLLDNQPFCLVAPDAGAAKKTQQLALQLGGLEVISCHKKRDVRDGKLTGFTVYADDLSGKNCLICDDICDGGNTFLGVAAALRAKGAERVFLAVSHGIFSQGFDKLSRALDGIFTTDSFQNIQDERIQQVCLADLPSFFPF